MRNIVLRCLLAGCAVTAGSSAAAQSGARTQRSAHAYSIPPGPLRFALVTFAEQSNSQILFDPLVVKDAPCAGLSGTYPPETGLAKMLRGTAFAFTRVQDGVYLITAAPPRRLSAKTSAASLPADSSTDEPIRPEQEIIVTAQKREERLLDVPVPVTAVRARALAETSMFRVKDYFYQVPGLTLATSATDGAPTIAIRGISADTFGNPTVGVLVDDVPFGSSLAIGGGFIAPELDPSDLERIEVLRGPQGTLYGAASMGGLLKYVTVSPSLDHIAGRVQAGLSGISGGSHLGYDVSAALNLPAGDRLAFRVSGFARSSPGFIDNVTTGQRDVNRADVIGTHLSALWRPSGNFSVKLSALFQKNKQFGSPNVLGEPGLAHPRQAFIAGSGRLDRTFAAYSATVHAKLGGIDITSITGYINNNFDSSVDYTSNIGPLISTVFPGELAIDRTWLGLNKVSQELRLAPKIGERIVWLIGGFYTHESTPSRDHYISLDANGGVQGLFAQLKASVTYAEWAGFTDLTYRFSDRFDVQVGGRISRMAQSYSSIDTGPYVDLFGNGPSPSIGPKVRSHQTTFTYLFSPRFKVTPDIMLYARLASGYRPGGPNAANATAMGGGAIPASYRSDKTRNYEIGLKGDVLDHALTFDASVYYIDWADIQISSTTPTSIISYYDNGGSAKSQGIELTLQARPTDGLRLGGWVSLNKAVLTEDFPSSSTAYGARGDRVPFNSRVSASASADYDMHLTDSVTGSIGGTVSYVGKRFETFTSTPERQVLPAYTLVNLRAGLASGPWELSLYLNNATDRRAVLGGGVGTLFPDYFNIIQPRTMGFSLARTF